MYVFRKSEMGTVNLNLFLHPYQNIFTIDIY